MRRLLGSASSCGTSWRTTPADRQTPGTPHGNKNNDNDLANSTYLLGTEHQLQLPEMQLFENDLHQTDIRLHIETFNKHSHLRVPRGNVYPGPSLGLVLLLDVLAHVFEAPGHHPPVHIRPAPPESQGRQILLLLLLLLLWVM